VGLEYSIKMRKAENNCLSKKGQEDKTLGLNNKNKKVLVLPVYFYHNTEMQ
jgi:hypothetical protein